MLKLGQSAVHPARRERIAAGLLASVALLTAAGGVDSLLQHFRESPERPYRALCGYVLAMGGVWQLFVARSVWRSVGAFQAGRGGPHFWANRRQTLSAALWLRSPLFLGWLLAGLVGAYLLALHLGPERHARYAFRTAAAVAYMACLAPLVLPTQSLEALERVLQNWSLRLAGRLSRTLLLTTVAAELLLRGLELAAGVPIGVAWLTPEKLPAGGRHLGQPVNDLGYWDGPFVSDHRRGVFRVAALGRGLTLSPAGSSHLLARLEERLGNVEVYNFGLTGGGPRAYAAQIAKEVSQFQPDLVLVFLSIGSDLTGPTATPGRFDWRSVRLAQLVCGWTGAYAPAAEGRAADRADYEAHLHTCQAELAACRTPPPLRVARRWQALLSELDNVARQCENRNLPMALVLTPCQYQVDLALCEILCRRAGCDPVSLDLDLPQRRLASFADERGLAVIDLLPHIRDAGGNPFEPLAGRLSAGGHALAADALASWLEGRYGNLLAQAK